MTNYSDKFEKKICRIHTLLAGSGSTVTWNDKLPDPDNPDQTRQIDVTVKSIDSLTLIECRIHKKVQDVKWIEELMGRRLSLQADAVIAVSNSGFTLGAKQKAKQYGIILRDLQSLSEREIQQWGRNTSVLLTFLEYAEVEINFVVKSVLGHTSSLDNILKSFECTNTLYGIFEMASDAIISKIPTNKKCRFSASFKAHKLAITEIPIEEIRFRAIAKKIIQNLQIPSVVAYDAPHVKTTQREVTIAEVAFGDFEITQSSNNVFVVIDLSPLECPPNSQFISVNFDFGRTVKIRHIEILGPHQFSIPLEAIKFGLIVV
ncbi:restriction endonuclease [Undibacterium sp. TC9W]|uniref:restriction endonuclease n=1 Tax=Undibacterium sp. TC9W TaxID=3413053 RepID=UPI003BF2DBF3